jgi:DNA polymerase family B
LINQKGNRFSFDLASCVVADVETYPDRWCVGFRGLDREGRIVTTVVDGDRDKLRRTLGRFAETGRTLVTYNGDHFDVPVLRFTLEGFDPFMVGDAIIGRGRLPAPTSSLAALPCDHIDLAARLRRGGRIPSLKLLAAYSGRPTLRELPYAPGTILTDEQWADVIRYNAIDLGHTWALLERFTPELQALAAISEEQGQDLRSQPSPRVVEHVFLSAYREQRGVEPVRPEMPREVLYHPVPGVHRLRTPEARAWSERVVGVPLPMVGEGDRRHPDVPRAQFTIGGLGLTVGSGGVHSIDSPRVYYETRNTALFSVDVASFYPSLIATRGITPQSLGDIGSQTYRQILERRLEVKQRAKTVEDAEDRKRLNVQADALKLLLNSTSGKLGDPYSILFDPAAYLTVTLSGQLMLIDLIERLTSARVRVLSANTDGLFIKVSRRNRRWRKVIAGWQADTQMTLEVDPLRRLAILASNRFATLDRSGKITRKGAGVKGDFRLSPLAAPNGFIIADAVVGALLEDIPPERTVRSCADPVRFCSVTQRAGKVQAAVLVDAAGGTETELPKVARWYKATESGRRIEHRLGGGRHTTPADAVGINLALDLNEESLPEDLDVGWYIAQARRIIQSVPGYRHRSVRRLLDHPEALALHHLGLVPVPAWAGMTQPPRAARAAPTYLWDWDSYVTFGTCTGPAAGILALGVDRAAKFRATVDQQDLPLFGSRWRDLADCLVSCRSDATPEDVRTGRARGTLIFRLVGDASHPLARMARSHWLKDRGVEVFYGAGIPSVLGEHPDGTRYRLDGTLGLAPDWLVLLLIPKKANTGTKPDDEACRKSGSAVERDGFQRSEAGPLSDSE